VKKASCKKELPVKYDIETPTISNFFHSQLQSYKLTGGNRNRQIVLKKTQLKTIMARSW